MNQIENPGLSLGPDRLHSSEEIRDRGNATAPRPSYQRERATTKHRNVRLAKRHLVNMNWFTVRIYGGRFCEYRDFESNKD